MEYQAIRTQVLALLQQEKRLSYRVLKRQLQLDDETLEDLYVLTHSAYFHQFRSERAQAHAFAERALQLAMEQGFSIVMAGAKMVLGEAVEPRAIAEGMARTREGIAAYRGAGAELILPFHLTQLAEAHGQVGRPDEGLAALDEALSIVERGGEHTWDADLYRVKGELMRMTDADESEVEACFHHAREIARRQRAKSYELRAVLSLSRLWQQQGKQAEAYELLAPIYGWFTEGFETADLQEAKALLEELS
jgi:predicted ATPase